VKARLLLDSHVPADVAEAVRDLVPGVDVQHVSTWQEGAYSNAADDVLLDAGAAPRRTQVNAAGLLGPAEHA